MGKLHDSSLHKTAEQCYFALQFPSLMCQYLKLITYLAEIYPEKVVNLSPDLLKNLMASVQIGLASYPYACIQ